jgi:hypothetical protein
LVLFFKKERLSLPLDFLCLSLLPLPGQLRTPRRDKRKILTKGEIVARSAPTFPRHPTLVKPLA